MGDRDGGDFAGKVAFVTGSASGIGRAAALAFAQEGAAVAAANLSESENLETVSMIEELGGRALALSCDVFSSDDVKNALDKATAELGPLGVACNNAGIEQPITAAADLSEEEWDRILAVNLSAAYSRA